MPVSRSIPNFMPGSKLSPGSKFPVINYYNFLLALTFAFVLQKYKLKKSSVSYQNKMQPNSDWKNNGRVKKVIRANEFCRGDGLWSPQVYSSCAAGPRSSVITTEAN